MEQTLYYNPNKMLSYNRILNFVIGARGIGKSYATKKYCINRFLKFGEQFMYVRRYKDELKKIKTFFNDIMGEFPDTEFKVKGREFYINGKLAGYAVPLSMWQSIKSNAYPNVKTIFYDEFIREKDNSGYIPNEVSSFMNLCDTVIRTRDDSRIICLSNAVTIVNPYFIYFQIVPDVNRRYNAYESVLVEIPDSKDFAEERKKTRFGKLIAGTDYADMALNNEFVNDSPVFIEKRSKQSKFVFAVVYNGMTIGVWVDLQKTLMYLSQDYDPSSKMIFALEKDDLKEGIVLASNWKQNYYMRKLVGTFMNGMLRFDNQVMRNIGYEMFNKMRVQ